MGEFVHSRFDQIPAGLTGISASRDHRSGTLRGGANSRRDGTLDGSLLGRSKRIKPLHRRKRKAYLLQLHMLTEVCRS